MAEITWGIRSILSHPAIYNISLTIVGVNKFRQKIIKGTVQPFAGMRILDIGCGPGHLLEFVPETVEYLGFDLNQDYINQAINRYGKRATFICSDVCEFSYKDISNFDVVIAFGVLHHLDDDASRKLFEIAYHVLMPKGRLITAADPCFEDGQSPIARLIAKWDRGQNVRTHGQYVSLASQHFVDIESSVVHKHLGIPYTSHIMICTKPEADFTPSS